MSSILNDTKSLLGINPTDTSFDINVITEINTAFAKLNQLGVGPDTCFYIEDVTDTWEEFSSDRFVLSMVKTYIYLSVQLVFDTPLNSSVSASRLAVKNELEWRLQTQCDSEEDEESN